MLPPSLLKQIASFRYRNGFAQAAGQGLDVQRLSSLGRHFGHVAGHGRQHGILFLYPLDSSRQHYAESQVRIAGRVRGSVFDAYGARACGYRGAYVNRYGLPMEETPYLPDMEVNDFLELAARLIS